MASKRSSGGRRYQPLRTSLKDVHADRRATREYVHFLNVANGSSAEARYLVDVAGRLGLISAAMHVELEERWTEVIKGLHKLITALDNQP